MTVKEAREYFRRNYSHVNIQGVDDPTIQEFLDREYVSKLSLPQQMNLMYDYILSQGLTEIEE